MAFDSLALFKFQELSLPKPLLSAIYEGTSDVKDDFEKMREAKNGTIYGFLLPPLPEKKIVNLESFSVLPSICYTLKGEEERANSSQRVGHVRLSLVLP